MTTNPQTFPHGATLEHTTTAGYEIRRRGRLVGRVHIRTTARSRWSADIFAYDGFAWTLDRRTPAATLRETRDAVRDYVAAYDRFAYVASGDCHR